MQPVQPRHHDSLQRVGNANGRNIPHQLPATIVWYKHLIINERTQHLLQIEWIALRAAKNQLPHTLRPLADAYQVENEVSAAVMQSKDAREGPRAFKEKRKPVFTGE